MVKKTDMVREELRSGDYKKALKIAKGFRINVTKEQQEVMTRAYECIVHPEFYKQIGVDILASIEKGKETVMLLYGA